MRLPKQPNPGIETKASANKSFGDYKPVIVHDNGSQEIVGKKGRYIRIQTETVFYGGPSEMVRYQRGKTFPTKEEAVALARISHAGI